MDRASARVRLRGVAAAAIWLAASALAAEPAPAAPRAADGGGKASDYKQAQFLFRLGYRALAGDTWEAARGQTAVGFEGDWRPRGWPVWPTFAMNLSADSENDQFAGEEDGVLFELSGGVKRYFLHRVRPYVGGGLAWIYGRQDRLRYVSQQIRATVSHRETTFGVYLQAGFSLRFGSRFHCGVDARALRGTNATFFGLDSSLDYDEVTLFVGWAW